MLPLIKSETFDETELKWGKKRRLGGKKGDVQFYESFTYDGVDYSLYDCIYMYKQGEPAPYIGKLIKMWETPVRNNKIKVQWFFRPSEISYYLKDAKVLENELFFASGDGIGLADLNPLEAVAGKCNVVCTSTDRRNPQPSAKELQMADYVFYRTFDVKSCTISDQIDDKVGGLEVNFVFNRREGIRTHDIPKLDSGEKYEARNVVACEKTLSFAGSSSPQQLNSMKLDENGKNTLEEDANVSQVAVNQGCLVGRHSSSVDAISSRNMEILGATLEERNTQGAKSIERSTCEKKGKSKDIKSSVGLVQAEKGMKKYARKSCDIDDAPSKRTKFDVSVSSDSNIVLGLSVPRKDAANLSIAAATSKGQLKSGLGKDSIGCRKDTKFDENSRPLDEKLSKTGFSLSKDVSTFGHAEDYVGIQKNSKSNGNLNALSKAKELSSAEKEKLGSPHRKYSFVDVKDTKLGGNLSSSRENSSETNAVSCVETHKPSTTNVLPNQTQKPVPNKDLERLGPSIKPIQSFSTSMKRPGVISAQETKEKSNLGHDKSHEINERFGKAAKSLQSLSTSMERMLEVSAQECKKRSNLGHDKSLEKEEKLADNSCTKDKGYIKRAKLDDSIKLLEVNQNNKIKNLKVNNSLTETKNSPKHATSSDNNLKSRLDEGPSNEYCDVNEKTNVCERKNFPKILTRDDKEKLRLGEGLSNMHRTKKNGKLLTHNLPSPVASKSKDDGGKVGGKIIEVTPKPHHKQTWMKLSWDEQMKTAHDQGKLVLLQNLDPEYTSGEVEDIIWHTFKESCDARMVPHTAISNPFSGQAFVAFKTSGAASKVVQKLDDECLMLPNQRPLVACYGVLPKSSEKKAFVGHLAIDKGWRQTQRDVKEAVSTCHYSQHNTIAYTMAMDWCLLQLQSDKWWRDLHELQRKELKKLRQDLQTK